MVRWPGVSCLENVSHSRLPHPFRFERDAVSDRDACEVDDATAQYTRLMLVLHTIVCQPYFVGTRVVSSRSKESHTESAISAPCCLEGEEPAL